MTVTYGNGIGDTLGDALVTCKPLITSGNVWYVNSTGGVNAASPAGQNREKPLATVAQALTNSADNDIIVLLSGHTETTTAGIAVSKKVTIVGAGSSGGLPTVTFINNAANDEVFAVSSTNVSFRNIRFPASLQANTGGKITSSSNNLSVIGCYFECGANDNAGALRIGGGTNLRIKSSTFISVATLVTAQPESAISITGACTDVEIDGLVLSGGTVGFANFRAFDGSAGAITRLTWLNGSLLLGADVKLNAATTGYVNFQTVTGGSRLDW